MNMKPELRLFPARIMIKVILHARDTEKENQRIITEALAPLGYTPTGFSSRLSGKGQWMSVTFFSEIPSQEELRRVYAELEDIPGVRMIL